MNVGSVQENSWKLLEMCFCYRLNIVSFDVASHSVFCSHNLS